MARAIARRLRNGLALVALLVAAGIGLAGCGGGSDGTSSAQTRNDESPAVSPERGQNPTLVDVSSVRELGDRFNADIGEPRLVLLLSPT